MHQILKVLITSSIFYNFTAGMLGPIYAIFAREIGGDIFVASSSIAIYSAVVGTLIFIFGRFEDRLDKRKVFLIGRTVNVVGIAGYLFVSSPADLFIVQAILGIAIAMMNPTFSAMYSRGLRKKHEAFEWSVWEGSINFSIAAAAIVGGFVAATYGFKALFMTMAATALISLIVATFVVKKNVWSELRRMVDRHKTIHA